MNMRRSKFGVATAAFAACVLALSGCGAGGDNNAADNGTTD